MKWHAEQVAFLAFQIPVGPSNCHLMVKICVGL